MATILYPDGTSQEVQPTDGVSFHLEQLRAIVGGYIEIIPTRDRRIMVLNEEGKLEGLPRNEQATALVDFPTREDYDRLKAVLGDALILVGDPSDLAADFIAGTVLVCLSKEVE